MKRIVLLMIIITSAVASFAQAVPQAVNFSAIVRDTDSVLLVNTPVTVKISFIAGGQYGTVVYCAEHSAVTDANGFVSFQLNRGEYTCGCNGALNMPFAGIPWHDGNMWMRVEYRTDGDYVNLGTKEVASSYYALVSRKAEKLSNINFYVGNVQDGDVLVYRGNVETFMPVTLDSIYYLELPAPSMSEVLSSGNSADGRRISGLANPVDSGDASTKSYVDSLVSIIDVSFEHLNDPPAIVAPVVSTGAYRNLTSNSATLLGVLCYNNGDAATCGFIYGVDEHNMTDSVAIGIGTGNFNYEASGLLPLTKYYYKAFASNSVATTYGRTFSFITAADPANCIMGTFTDSRDGNVYATVTIGEQTWMAENLRYRGSLPLYNECQRPYEEYQTPWIETDQYVAYPNNDSTNVAVYGYLYNQAAALNGTVTSSQIPSGLRGVCPYGWHLPSSGEWQQLIDMFDRTITSPQLAGSPELWTNADSLYVQNVNFGASCFNAVPAGYYVYAGGGNQHHFDNFGSSVRYLTSTGVVYHDRILLENVNIGYIFSGMIIIDNEVPGYFINGVAKSVRCVRDN